MYNLYSNILILNYFIKYIRKYINAEDSLDKNKGY